MEVGCWGVGVFVVLGGGVVGGGGGYAGFQVTGIIEWGQKPKPKKILRPSNKIQKNPMPNFRALKIKKN